ncbi:MAG TPA: hypothetical protein VFY21_07310 [Xanthobacteraceae bacterium]|nr:hypothetical protein [Xanthobacteraceae bacterium]
MRQLRFVAVAAAIVFAAPAFAETHIFVFKGDDGYGVHDCLASGEQCGEAAASAICRARDYVQAVNFGRVDTDEITGAVPADKRPARCEGKFCPLMVAVTCAR